MFSRLLVLPGSDTGSDGVKPTSSLIIQTRAPCGARCMGHVIRTLPVIRSEAPHLQFGERARSHLHMNKWNCPTPVCQSIKLDTSCSGLAHSNRLGTGLGCENTGPGCTLAVLRVLSIIRPLRSANN